MQIKKYLQKILTNNGGIANHASLSKINPYLLNPLLWHINRRSISKGVAIGFLIAFLPIPMQMLVAAILAVMFRANLPIAIVMTWITNPITFFPINFFIYKVGELFVSNDGYHTIQDFEFKDKSWDNIASQFLQWLQSIGKPFLIGLPIVAISSSIIGYFLVHFIWRLSFYYRIKKRKKGG